MCQHQIGEECNKFRACSKLDIVLGTYRLKVVVCILCVRGRRGAVLSGEREQTRKGCNEDFGRANAAY